MRRGICARDQTLTLALTLAPHCAEVNRFFDLMRGRQANFQAAGLAPPIFTGADIGRQGPAAYDKL
jgi:hypothetical protein